MTTNFFQSISGLNIAADWKITITKTESGNLIVAALLVNEQVGDSARKLIPPMTLKGTPQELDEGFFNSIAAPAKVTSQLFTNMEAYLKAQEQARTQSRMMEEQTKKQKTEQDESKKKYEAILKKVAELETQGKYGEAIAQMPTAEVFPAFADAIKERNDSLWQKRREKEQTLF